MLQSFFGSRDGLKLNVVSQQNSMVWNMLKKNVNERLSVWFTADLVYLLQLYELTRAMFTKISYDIQDVYYYNE